MPEAKSFQTTERYSKYLYSMRNLKLVNEKIDFIPKPIKDDAELSNIL